MRTMTAALPLSEDHVYLWWAFLDVPEAVGRHLAHTLSAAERAQAGRFYDERLRYRYMVCRGILRLLLGRCLGLAPDALRLVAGRHGKPALDPSHGCDLRFNLSHSRGVAVYALARRREVGVDLEYLDPAVGAERISAYFLSTRERTVFHSLPAAEKVTGFFNCWTRKEAYLKACGDGLRRPPADVTVSLHPAEPARLLHDCNDRQAAARWSLRGFSPVDGYVACLAVEGDDFGMSLQRLPVCGRPYATKAALPDLPWY